ncbi:hypothetical protein DASC09_057640 [Saccharomycopsis crataegensis]|uniref:Uncharacterized protein n=1 Tax=Saccharomycopsis crataegensis TaxID=43959 RepID=A0AAV5QU02_9ASCO|nr:hypothetical protein DASC09_057640 [Saccharomycopsis crataegensis]
MIEHTYFEEYPNLSIEERLSFLKTVSTSIVSNDLQKRAILNNHTVFLRKLLDDLLSTADSQEHADQLVNYSLLILNSLIYLTYDALPIFSRLNAISYLIRNATLLTSQLSGSSSSQIILKNLSWNFKAFAKILFYTDDSDLVYTVNDDFIDSVVLLMAYSPSPSASGASLLDIQESYNSCLFNLFNVLSILANISDSMKIKMYPYLLKKVLIETYPILDSLINPSLPTTTPSLTIGQILSNINKGDSIRLEHIDNLDFINLNNKLINRLDTKYPSFKNFYFSNTLPEHCPINLSLIPIFLPSMFYSFANMLDIKDPQDLIRLLNENDSSNSHGNLILPKNLYFVLCGFLNSSNSHIKLSSMNILQKYCLNYVNHLQFQIDEESSSSANIVNNKIIFHTVSKYLPYLMNVFHPNDDGAKTSAVNVESAQSHRFSNDIPISKNQKPSDLVLQVCKFSSTNLDIDPANQFYEMILKKLQNYNVLKIVTDKLLHLLIHKLIKTFERNYIDETLTSSKHKKHKSNSPECIGALHISHSEKKLISFSKSNLYFTDIASFEAISDANFLFKYASIDDLELFLNCFEILNCFMSIKNNNVYKKFALNQLLSIGNEPKVHENAKTIGSLHGSRSFGNDNTNVDGNVSYGYRTYLNNLNLIVVNVLALQLRVCGRIEKLVCSSKNNGKKGVIKLLDYLSKNFYKNLLINKLAQSLVNFLKFLSTDILLLRSFFVINFNKELVIDLMIRINKFSLEDIIRSFNGMDSCEKINEYDNCLNISITDLMSKILNGPEKNSRSSLQQQISKAVIISIRNFENFKTILRSIIETKTLVCLLFANLSLEFSPIQQYLLSLTIEKQDGKLVIRNHAIPFKDTSKNVLIDMIATNISGIYTSDPDETAAIRNYDEFSFVNYIFCNSMSCFGNKSNLEKLDFIEDCFDYSNNSQEAFRIVNLGSGSPNVWNIDINNFNYCKFEEFINGSVSKDISLKVGYTTLVNFVSIYSLKHATLMILKNLLYESPMNLKTDFVLKNLQFKNILKPLMVDCVLATSPSVMNRSGYTNTPKIKGFVLDYKTELVNIVRNLISDLPRIIGVLSFNIRESGPCVNDEILDGEMEEFFMDLTLKHLTLSNIIEKPKLVTNILFVINNLLTLNETFRNIVISNEILMKRLKLILDLSMQGTFGEDVFEIDEASLNTFVDIDMEVLHNLGIKGADIFAEDLSMSMKDDFIKKFSENLVGMYEQTMKQNTGGNYYPHHHNVDFFNIKLACVWIVINLIWDQDDPDVDGIKKKNQHGDIFETGSKQPMSGFFNSRDSMTIVDRYKKLVALGFYESVQNLEKSEMLDLKQRASAAVKNFDTIKSELESLGASLV